MSTRTETEDDVIVSRRSAGLGQEPDLILIWGIGAQELWIEATEGRAAGDKVLDSALKRTKIESR